MAVRKPKPKVSGLSKSPAKKTAAKKKATPKKRVTSLSTPPKKAASSKATKKAVSKKAPAKKAPAKKTAKTPSINKGLHEAVAEKEATKAPAKKSSAKKAPAKKAPAKKTTKKAAQPTDLLPPSTKDDGKEHSGYVIVYAEQFGEGDDAFEVEAFAFACGAWCKNTFVEASKEDGATVRIGRMPMRRSECDVHTATAEKKSA